MRAQSAASVHPGFRFALANRGTRRAFARETPKRPLLGLSKDRPSIDIPFHGGLRGYFPASHPRGCRREVSRSRDGSQPTLTFRLSGVFANPCEFVRPRASKPFGFQGAVLRRSLLRTPPNRGLDGLRCETLPASCSRRRSWGSTHPGPFRSRGCAPQCVAPDP